MADPSWLPPGWFPGDALPIVPGSATADIIGLIAKRCRRAAPDGSIFQAEIITEIVHAQRKLEEGPTLPWFLKRTSTITSPAGESIIGLDSVGYPVIRLQDDKPVSFVHPEAPEPIEIHQEAEWKILTQKYPGTADSPVEFYIENNEIWFRPIPLLEWNYVIRFYHNDIEPVIGGTTLWLRYFPDLVMNLAGYEVAWSLRDQVAADRFGRDLQVSRHRFVNAVAAREEAGQTHIMGDD